MVRIEGTSGLYVGAEGLELASKASQSGAQAQDLLSSAQTFSHFGKPLQTTSIPWTGGTKGGSQWADDALKLAGNVISNWGGSALSSAGGQFMSALSSMGNSALSGLSSASSSALSSLSSWGGSALSGLSSVGSAIARGGSSLFSAGSSLASGAASLLGKAVPYLGLIEGGFGMFKNFGDRDPVGGASNGMAIGASIGSIFPVVGTAIGSVVGAVAGALMGCIQSGKHKDQKQRDTVRAALQDAGVIDKNYTLPLADGSRYDIGKDGGKRAEFGGLRPYEIDFTRPFAHEATAMGLEIAKLFSNGNQKIESDFAGYFANAAMSNATSLEQVKANMESIKGAFGIAPAKTEEVK